MDSRLRVQGHPIQPMLVTVPFGLFACATLFDAADLTGGPVLLGQVGYWTALAGLVAAALVTAAGMIDLWDAPGDRTRRTVVTFHLVTAGSAVLFVMACLIRAGGAHHGATGPALAAELTGLVVGALGVALGVRLVRLFDRGRVETAAFEPGGSRLSFFAGSSAASAAG